MKEKRNDQAHRIHGSVKYAVLPRKSHYEEMLKAVCNSAVNGDKGLLLPEVQ